MFGADWRDANRYDVVINMGKMCREGAKRVIIEAPKLDEYQRTAASSQAFTTLLSVPGAMPRCLRRPMYKHRLSKFAPKAAVFT